MSTERLVDARGVLDEAIGRLQAALMERRVCIDEDEAREIAEAVLLDTWQEFAGTTVYFRRTLLNLVAARDRKLYADHLAGVPVRELCIRHKLSDRHVYRIIRRIEQLDAPQQQSLFA